MIKFLLFFAIANFMISVFIATPRRVGDKWEITPYTNHSLKAVLFFGFLYLISD